MAPGKDLEQEARQLTEIIRATCQMLDSRTLPNAKRERLQHPSSARRATRQDREITLASDPSSVCLATTR